MRRALTLIAAGALFALAGCGDEGGGGDDEAVIVIEDWAETLSSGDVEGAAEYFALPSLVQNGTPALELDTREDVVRFNASLPCGAELLRAEPAGELIHATFRLTDRPGSDCAAGSGGLARTAFRISDGEIAEWRRLPDPRPVEGPLV